MAECAKLFWTKEKGRPVHSRGTAQMVRSVLRRHKQVIFFLKLNIFRFPLFWESLRNQLIYWTSTFSKIMKLMKFKRVQKARIAVILSRFVSFFSFLSELLI